MLLRLAWSHWPVLVNWIVASSPLQGITHRYVECWDKISIRKFRAEHSKLVCGGQRLFLTSDVLFVQDLWQNACWLLRDKTKQRRSFIRKPWSQFFLLCSEIPLVSPSLCYELPCWLKQMCVYRFINVGLYRKGIWNYTWLHRSMENLRYCFFQLTFTDILQMWSTLQWELGLAAKKRACLPGAHGRWMWL